MPLHQYTSLARKLDFSYPNNRFISVFAGCLFLGLILYGALVGAAMGRLIPKAFELGLTVFLTWAIQRELDPDHPLNASLMSVVAAAAWFYFQDSSLLLLAFAMLGTRVINRSTGLRPRNIDLAVTMALGVATAYLGLWPVAYLTAFLFLLAHRLEPDDNRYHRFGWAALLIALPLTFLHRGIYGNAYDPISIALSALLVISLVAAFCAGTNIKSKCDFRGNCLENRRLKATLLFASLTVLALLLFHGTDAVRLSYGLIACALMSNLVYVVSKGKRKLFAGKGEVTQE